MVRLTKKESLLSLDERIVLVRKLATNASSKEGKQSMKEYANHLTEARVLVAAAYMVVPGPGPNFGTVSLKSIFGMKALGKK